MSRRNLPTWLSSASVPFAEAISARRIELGWTKARVAKKAGVSPKILGQYEAGTALPNIERAAAIAAALRISLDAACGLAAARPFSVHVDGVRYAPLKGSSGAPVAAGEPEARDPDLDAAVELEPLQRGDAPPGERSRRPPQETPP